MANPIKLHSFVSRMAYDHNELFVLCSSPAMAQEIYEKLMPATAPKFDASKGQWADIDITPARSGERK